MILESLNCLGAIKNQIVNELDALLVLDENELINWSRKDCNTHLQSMVSSKLNDFMIQIDTPDILRPSLPIQNHALSLNMNTKIDTSMLYGAIMLTALIAALVTDKFELQISFGVVMIASFVGLSRSKVNLFHSKEEDEEQLAAFIY